MVASERVTYALLIYRTLPASVVLPEAEERAALASHRSLQVEADGRGQLHAVARLDDPSRARTGGRALLAARQRRCAPKADRGGDPHERSVSARGPGALALVDYKGSRLVVKLPCARLAELVASGVGPPVATAGRASGNG